MIFLLPMFEHLLCTGGGKGCFVERLTALCTNAFWDDGGESDGMANFVARPMEYIVGCC